MVCCHRWPLRRYTSKRYLPDYGDNGEGGSVQAESSDSDGGREGGGGVGAAGGRGGAELWGTVRKAFRNKNNTDCDCKWCKMLGSSRCMIFAQEMIIEIRERAGNVDMLAFVLRRARLSSIVHRLVF